MLTIHTNIHTQSNFLLFILVHTFLLQFRKRYENADNQKNIAVMKYVKNESELINIRKERETLVKRVKGVEHEREELSKKLKILMSEKNTISQTLEQKVCSFDNKIFILFSLFYFSPFF